MTKYAQIYDFKIEPGGSFSLNVEGDYVRIMDCIGPVELLTDSYRLGPLQAGQGQENAPYRRLTINNKSASTNIGHILVASSGFIDQRINGVVSVSDVGKVNSLAGNNFYTAMNVNGSPSNCQLWNPVNSGINAFITSYAFSTDISTTIMVRDSTSQLDTFQGYPPSKLLGGQHSKCEARVQSGYSGLNLGSYYPAGPLPNNSIFTPSLKEPLVIPPGHGLYCSSTVSNTVLGFILEFTEETL